MRTFEFTSFPDELQNVVFDIPNLEINETGDASFKVITQADPEWGNVHVALALYLVKQGAKKGEVVTIKGITRN